MNGNGTIKANLISIRYDFKRVISVYLAFIVVNLPEVLFLLKDFINVSFWNYICYKITKRWKLPIKFVLIYIMLQCNLVHSNHINVRSEGSSRRIAC